MAKVHDLFIVELAEVIKGYGNDPDDKDPFRMSEFYRFYELPNIAVSRENFEKMLPIDPVRKGKWIPLQLSMANPPYQCSCCFRNAPMVETGCLVNRHLEALLTDWCPWCGAKMEEPEDIPMEYFESGGR